jgi:hypothetical protein
MARKKTTTATKPKKPATKKKTTKRTSWLSSANTPLIEQYAKQMKSFAKAFADGVIEDSEIKEQESRLVELMKEVEPQLDDALHGKVTELLCEISVYDLMQMMTAMQKARPQSEFRG